MHKGSFLTFTVAAAVGGLSVLACVASSGLDNAQERVLSGLPVVVFFQSNLPEDQTHALSDSLISKDNAIEQITYISREQAYADASKDPLLNRSLMLLHDNPFSATAEIHYAGRAWVERQDPAQLLRQISGIQDIRWNAQRRDAYLAFEPWKKTLRRSLWVVAGLLILWAAGGIRIFAQRLKDWKNMGTQLGAGFCGAAVFIFVESILLAHAGFQSMILTSRDMVILPLLFGALVGMGSFREPSV